MQLVPPFSLGVSSYWQQYLHCRLEHRPTDRTPRHWEPCPKTSPPLPPATRWKALLSPCVTSWKLPNLTPKHYKSPSPPPACKAPLPLTLNGALKSSPSGKEPSYDAGNLPKSLAFHFCFLKFNFDVLYLIS